MNRSHWCLWLLLVVGLSGCATLPSARTKDNGDGQIEYALIRSAPPVVVFENGLGATMDRWSSVFHEVGKEATVFAYNRPGYGDSDPAPTPRDGVHIVEELRVFLHGENLLPPYVLVGHSLGGLYMQFFAHRYPEEIAGLVLVDSTHPTQLEGAGALENQPLWVRALFGLFVAGTAKQEFSAAPQTGQEILRLPTVSGRPVILLSAVDKTDSDVVRHANQKRADLARLYPGSRQLWVDSGHNIQLEKPAVVIEAIRDILAQSRH